MSGVKKRSGRRPKEIDQEIVEKLSLLDDLFFSELEKALKDSKSWALKLFANHRLPKPNNTLEIASLDEVPLFNITYSVDEINQEDHVKNLTGIDIENQMIS